MSTPMRQVSPERQALYYGGMALVGLGGLLYLSLALSVFSDIGRPKTVNELFGLNAGPFDYIVGPDGVPRSANQMTMNRHGEIVPINHSADPKANAGFFIIGGTLLNLVGASMMNVGAKGWAGSGVILNPEQARRDLEPWSRMGGRILQDTSSEIEVMNALKDRLDSPGQEVMVRCQRCQVLNPELNKFCGQCGAAI